LDGAVWADIDKQPTTKEPATKEQQTSSLRRHNHDLTSAFMSDKLKNQKISNDCGDAAVKSGMFLRCEILEADGFTFCIEHHFVEPDVKAM